VLGRMAGRRQRPQREPTEFNLFAVRKTAHGVVVSASGGDEQHSAKGTELPGTGHEVGVQMGFDCVADLKPTAVGFGEVGGGMAGRVDDQSTAVAEVDEIRRVAQPVVDKGDRCRWTDHAVRSVVMRPLLARSRDRSCTPCPTLVKLSFEYLTSRSDRRTMGGVGDRAAKDALFEGFAEVAKALASGRRAEIVDVLAQGERPVEEIAEEIAQSTANTSHHLRGMARAGLVTTRRDGTRIFYRLASERVAELWSALRDVAVDHVAGIERLAGAYLGDRDGVDVIDRQELAARLERGEVLVLDVRPKPEYASGHIAGARSVPISELRRQLRALAKDTDVVAYCRGPYCVYADDAVRELNRKGFHARRLIDGYPEWKRAGLPVAAGDGAGGDGRGPVGRS